MELEELILEKLRMQYAGGLVIYELTINDDIKKELPKVSNKAASAEADIGFVCMNDKEIIDEQDELITICAYDTSHINPEAIHDPQVINSFFILKMTIEKKDSKNNLRTRIREAENKLTRYYNIIKNKYLLGKWDIDMETEEIEQWDIDMEIEEIEQVEITNTSKKNIFKQEKNPIEKINILKSLDKEGALFILKKGISIREAGVDSNDQKDKPTLLETLTRPYNGAVKVKFVEIDAIKSKMLEENSEDIEENHPQQGNYQEYHLQHEGILCVTDHGTIDKQKNYTRIVMWDNCDIDFNKISDPLEEQQILVLYSTIKESEETIITGKNRLTFYYDLLSNSELKEQLITAKEVERSADTEKSIKGYIAKLHKDDVNIKNTLEILGEHENLVIMSDRQIKNILQEAYEYMGPYVTPQYQYYKQKCKKSCDICERQEDCGEEIFFTNRNVEIDGNIYKQVLELSDQISKETNDLLNNNTEEVTNVEYCDSMVIENVECEVKKTSMGPRYDPMLPTMINYHDRKKDDKEQRAVLQLLGIEQKKYEGEIKVNLIEVENLDNREVENLDDREVENLDDREVENLDNKEIENNDYEKYFHSNPCYICLTDYSIAEIESDWFRIIAYDMTDFIKQRAERPWNDITIDVYYSTIKRIKSIHKMRKNILAAKNEMAYYCSTTVKSWLTETNEEINSEKYIDFVTKHPKARKCITDDLSEKGILNCNFQEKAERIMNDIIREAWFTFREKKMIISKQIEKQRRVNMRIMRNTLKEQEEQEGIFFEKPDVPTIEESEEDALLGIIYLKTGEE